MGKSIKNKDYFLNIDNELVGDFSKPNIPHTKDEIPNSIRIGVENALSLARDTSKINVGGAYEVCKDDLAKEISRVLFNQTSIRDCR